MADSSNISHVKKVISILSAAGNGHEVVICSRNRVVPGRSSKIPYPVPNPGNYPVLHRSHTKYHHFWPVFASVYDVKQYYSSE